MIQIKKIIKRIFPSIEQKAKTKFLYTLSVEEFSFLKKHSKRSNSILGITIPDIKELSYELVKLSIPEYIKAGRIDNIVIDTLNEVSKKKITIHEINKCNRADILCFFFWIIDSLNEINTLEEETLQSFPDADMINAGLQEFEQFGLLNTIDALAVGDILKWNRVVKLPYFDVYQKVLKNKVETDFQKRYNKIINPKK